VRTGSTTGTVLGSAAVSNTGSWTTFADVTANLTSVPSGNQNLYLTFTGSGSGLFDVDDFTLQKSSGSGTGPIVGLASKCLDVANGGTADGTKIQLYTCNGGGAQQWTVSGQVIRNPQSNKCLDVSAAGTANGTKVQLWTCNGTAAQNWQAQANGTVKNPNSNKCLDVSANSSADGQQIHIWDCHNGANQIWVLP
jgi:hypothetical protein